MLEHLDLPSQVALAVSVVAALRARTKKLDGWYVVVAVALVSLAVALVTEPSPLAAGAVARHSIVLFLYALGGMSALSHVAQQVGSALAGKGKPDAPER
jgi:hypothetical protein